jgi:hypothetical protein
MRPYLRQPVLWDGIGHEHISQMVTGSQATIPEAPASYYAECLRDIGARSSGAEAGGA